MEAPDAIAEKRLKTLRKKLRQIEELKQKPGCLDQEAQTKIDAEQAIRDEIASLELPLAEDVAGAAPRGNRWSRGKCGLFAEIERALADVPSDAALLLGASRKEFLALQKSLRDAVKLQNMEKKDALQVEKLQRLTEEAPSLLSQFLPLLTEAKELASVSDERHITKLRAEREALVAAREAAAEATAAAAAAASRREAPPRAAPSPVTPPRIGIDVGGVLNKYLNDVSEEAWELMTDSEAPGAMAALGKCVKHFGPANVFILSKCRGVMKSKTETWLFKTMGICDGAIGMRRGNVFFCNERFGRDGKGGVAEPLQLSHFVDDRDDCLWSVYEEGRSKAHVDLHGGRFFHMARGGSGRWPPQPREWPAEERPACVTPVRDWNEVLRHLGID